MIDWRQLALIGWLVLNVLLFCAVEARAHDCSDVNDCEAVPPNVDTATGLAGAAAGGLLVYLMLTRDRRKTDDPCQALRDEVAAGDNRIRDLERAVNEARLRGDGAKIPAMPGDRPKWIANIGPGPGSGRLPENPPDLLPKSSSGGGEGGHRPHAEDTFDAGERPKWIANISNAPSGGNLPENPPDLLPKSSQPSGEGGRRPHAEEDVPNFSDKPKWIANISTAPGTGKFPDKLPDLLKKPPGSSETGGRRPRPEDVESDDISGAMQAARAAMKALEAERAAQKARLAALGACEKAAAAADPAKEPMDIDALARALDDAKKEFEKLQEELRHQVGDRLNEVDKLVHDYDALWADAMKALDDYFAGINRIAGPLKELWDARADMDWYLALADAGDDALQALQMLAPALLELRALSAADKARLAARLAQAEEKALAKRALRAEAKAAEEAFVKKGAKDAIVKDATHKEAKDAVIKKFGAHMDMDNITEMSFTDMKTVSREEMEAMMKAKGKSLSDDVAAWYTRNDGRIVMEKGQATLHRAVHETIHSAQNPAIGGEFGEAMTEFLTTKVTKPMGAVTTSGYAERGYVEFAQRLEALAGKGEIEKAFFSKSPDAFKRVQQLVDSNAFGGPGTFKKVVEMSKNAANDPWWAMKATDLLIPKTPPGAFMGGL